MTRADLYALARDTSRPVETRRAASAALDALDAVDVRLRLDAGAAPRRARRRRHAPDVEGDVIASLLAFAARPLPPPSTAPRGLHPHRRSLDATTALRCRAAGLLAAALQGSGPRERALIDAAARALIDAAARALADLGDVHVMVASESARARQVAQRLHDAVTAQPEADRVPVLVAIVRALLDDAPDAMIPLDRAMRCAATWREVEITAEHERTAAELVREVGL